MSGFDCGQLTLDASGRRVFVNGEEIPLAQKEYNLLTTLASVPGKAWSKEELLDLVWGVDVGQWQDATITEHVSRLRRKLHLDADRPPYLQTIRGFGYRYERRSRPRWEPDQLEDA